MKIRLLSILVFFVLMLVLFCGCNGLDEANNQPSTNEVEPTHSSVSDITVDSTVSSDTEDVSTKSVDEISGTQVITSASETVNTINSEPNSEPSETETTNSNDKPQGEPEVNFSDLM